MLYDFHKTQSTKKPGSVYATYLIYGIKKTVQHQNGNAMDIDLPSSLPDADPDDDDDEVPSYTLALVQEDRLADALRDYETISSIHVYSVGPHPAKDLTLLVDAAQAALAIKDDAKKPRPRTIVNSHVRRRERRGPGLKAAAAAVPVKQESKAKAAPTKAATVKPAPAPAPAAAPAKPKEESKSTTPATEPEAPAAAAPTKKPAPSLKRNTSAASGIMQAFSKAASLPKKAKTAEKATPVETPVVLSDDGEDDDDDVPLPKPSAASSRKGRKEREEELRRMMEEDEDEDMEEKAESPAPEEEEEEPMAEEEPLVKAEAAKEEEKEIVTTTGDGRRRGKRRVMKKKQIMDDQGYLGKLLLPTPATVWLRNMDTDVLSSQSPFRNPHGSRSPKMRLRQPPSRSPRLRARRHPQRPGKGKSLRLRDKATSCRSSPRSSVWFTLPCRHLRLSIRTRLPKVLEEESTTTIWYTSPTNRKTRYFLSFLSLFLHLILVATTSCLSLCMAPVVLPHHCIVSISISSISSVWLSKELKQADGEDKKTDSWRGKPTSAANTFLSLRLGLWPLFSTPSPFYDRPHTYTCQYCRRQCPYPTPLSCRTLSSIRYRGSDLHTVLPVDLRVCQSFGRAGGVS